MVEEMTGFTIKETRFMTPEHAASPRRRTSSSVLGMRISSALRTSACSSPPPNLDGGDDSIEVLTARSAKKPRPLLARKKKYHVLV
jgi:hypothetical protein